MSSLRLVPAGFVLSLALVPAACVRAGPREPSHPATAPPQEEWVGGPVDFRRLTATVIARRSNSMRRQLQDAARRTKEPATVARFLDLASSEEIGSGFVMVLRERERVEGFVVTNEHVVGDAEDITLRFADGREYPHCQVLSVDRWRDVAVIGLPEGAPRFTYGLRPASEPPWELETVVAAGFPLVGQEPSFQVTEGSVSNASAHAPWSREVFIQHTAPMAEGSSGGPLTTLKGELLGVNTGGLRDREGAYFAIPVLAVEQAVRRAFQVRAAR